MMGKCALCDQDSELQLSHIMPKFVFNWLKRTSVGGIRANRDPNRRIQDGVKEYLLCFKCEQLFSSWEKPFSEGIFIPLNNSETNGDLIAYEDWALKFSVSVSWRTLLYFMNQNALTNLSEKQLLEAKKALKTWKQFLLGEIEHPHRFEHHLLPVDVLESHSTPHISPFLNRYFLRNIHLDVINSSSSALVYIKMGRVLIFAFIQERNSHMWKGTRLNVKRGTISPGKYSMPENIMHYLNDKADQVGRILAELSPSQKEKIESLVKTKADKMVDSDVFKAMSYDVFHSGDDAFEITKGNHD